MADTEDESDAVLQLSPSPYATAVLYEPLSFFCSANDSSYLMLWGISYFDEPFDLNAEVAFFNSSSTLLINTTAALNESVITCSVQEKVNQPYIYSQSTTILTQGISCRSDHSNKSIKCPSHIIHFVLYLELVLFIKKAP